VGTQINARFKNIRIGRKVRHTRKVGVCESLWMAWSGRTLIRLPSSSPSFRADGVWIDIPRISASYSIRRPVLCLRGVSAITAQAVQR
jgi:hypothetical protein